MGKTGEKKVWVANKFGIGKRPREKLDSEHLKVLRFLYDVQNTTNTSQKIGPRDYQQFDDPDIKTRRQSHTKWGSQAYHHSAVFKELENAGLIKHHSEYFDESVGSPQDIKYTLTKKGERLVEKIENVEEFGTRTDRLRRKTPYWIPATSIFFILAGLTFMILPGFSSTGNVVGQGTSGNFAFVLSLGLMVIGGILWFLSLKK